MADIKKIELNGQVYNIKDSVARESKIDLPSAPQNEQALIYNSTSAKWEARSSLTGAITSAIAQALNDAKDYTDSLLGGSASINISVVEELPVTGITNTIYFVPNGESTGNNIYNEYIYVESAWELIGTTEVDLSGYVQKTITIAGIDLQDNITAAELQTALGLGSLAYKEGVSATVTDYVTGITGASYTPAGTVSVTLGQTATSITSTGSYTPKGTITPATTSTAITSTGTFTPAGAIAKDNTNGVQITGTVSVTPATTTIKQVNSVGTAPSLTYTGGTFMTGGVDASVTGEKLVLGAKATGSASNITAWSAGSVPTTTSTSVATGITSATFTGDKYKFTGTSGNVSVSGSYDKTTGATFAGTQGDISVSGSYNKASVSSTAFTGTAATITPTLSKGSKTITSS